MGKMKKMHYDISDYSVRPADRESDGASEKTKAEEKYSPLLNILKFCGSYTKHNKTWSWHNIYATCVSALNLPSVLLMFARPAISGKPPKYDSKTFLWAFYMIIFILMVALLICPLVACLTGKFERFFEHFSVLLIKYPNSALRKRTVWLWTVIPIIFILSVGIIGIVFFMATKVKAGVGIEAFRFFEEYLPTQRGQQWNEMPSILYISMCMLTYTWTLNNMLLSTIFFGLLIHEVNCLENQVLESMRKNYINEAPENWNAKKAFVQAKEGLDLFYLLSDATSSSILAIYCGLTGGLCCGLYLMIFPPEETPTSSMSTGISMTHSAMIANMVLCQASTICLLTLLGLKNYNIGQELKEHLYWLGLTRSDADTRTRIILILSSLESNPPGLQAGGMFVVNHGTISMILVTVVTYTVLLIQTKPSGNVNGEKIDWIYEYLRARNLTS